MTEFEQQVLSDLAVLKSQMKMLLGDIRPGRISRLEAQVQKHEDFRQRAGGMAAAIGVVITFIDIAFDYLRHR